MPCARCGYEMGETDRFCRRCGLDRYQVEQPVRPRHGGVWNCLPSLVAAGIVLVLAVVFIGLVGYFL
jgi:hypothetical protein